MRFKTFIGVVLWTMLVKGNLFAQANLVPNPGFELKHSNGSCFSDSTRDFFWADGWYYPTLAPSAYCYVDHCESNLSIPQNAFGYQNAQEGNAYMFFQIVWDTLLPPYRAYLQTKLADTLILGHRYCFSAYLSLSDSSSRATDDFGAFFSDTAIALSSTESFNFVPQVQNAQGRFLKNKNAWMLVSGHYTSNGGEQYLTVGNFLDDYHTDWISVPPFGQFNYGWEYIGAYYIDMVSLYDCTGFDYTANAGEDGTVCRGEGVTIGTDEASNRKYSWSPAVGLSDSTAGRSLASPQQTTTYVLTVIDEFIQQTTDTVTVYVDESCGTLPVYVANIFTPNGDGNNDVLYVHSRYVKEISFRVYNRWGNIVFETKSLNTGWNGQCRSNDCPVGVYYYVAGVTFESGERVVKSGNVTIVR